MKKSVILEHHACVNCEAVKTPMWRRSPNHEFLCNACGLYFKTHGSHRPISYKKLSKPDSRKLNSGHIISRIAPRRLINGVRCNIGDCVSVQTRDTTRFAILTRFLISDLHQIGCILTWLLPKDPSVLFSPVFFPADYVLGSTDDTVYAMDCIETVVYSNPASLHVRMPNESISTSHTCTIPEAPQLALSSHPPTAAISSLGTESMGPIQRDYGRGSLYGDYPEQYSLAPSHIKTPPISIKGGSYDSFTSVVTNIPSRRSSWNSAGIDDLGPMSSTCLLHTNNWGYDSDRLVGDGYGNINREKEMRQDMEAAELLCSIGDHYVEYSQMACSPIGD